jgi:chromate reductase
MHASPETTPIELLFISGSLQRVSANRALLATAAGCAHAVARVEEFEGIAELPHFNPDLDGEAIAALAVWRAAIAHADAVVIATPEYAHSLPGSLKNALDWIVGSGELYDKPVALMSAGTSGGQRSLDALAQTLRAQGAHVVAQLPVPGVRPKLDEHGDLVDADTIAQVCALIGEIVETAQRSRVAPSPTNRQLPLARLRGTSRGADDRGCDRDRAHLDPDGQVHPSRDDGRRCGAPGDRRCGAGPSPTAPEADRAC